MSFNRFFFVIVVVMSTIIATVAPASAGLPGPAAPAAPTSLVAYRGNGSVEIAFTAGASNGAAITNYKYQLDGGSWTAFSPAVTTSSVTIGGLTNGTTYSVKLRAVNSVGDGAESDALSFALTAVEVRTWTAQTAAEANSWRSVTYGNGTFVAVASDGVNRVMTSSDGVTWTAQAAAEENPWKSVTYGNGVFVAVSDGGTNRVMTSSDGVTWTAQSVPARIWRSVTFGNGVFVALAVSGSGGDQVMTSSDGVTWTQRAATASINFTSATYGNGTFVAVASNGTNRVMTSPDGVTWTAQTAAAANEWASVTYGNGVFVATASTGTNRLMTSPDGVTWTARAQPEGMIYTALTFGNGVFVANHHNGKVMTSPDGVTWTPRTSSASVWSSVTYGGGKFVAVLSFGTNRVYTAPFTTTGEAPTSLSATSFDRSAFISFTPGSDGGTRITNYEYQLDGGSWTALSPAATSSPVTIGGLTNGATYAVKLRAVNAIGSGVASAAVSATAVAPSTPAAPTALTATRGYGSAEITFTAGANGGGWITNYEYQLDGGSWTALSPAVTSSPVTIGGLTNGTTYAVKLRAVNPAGSSAESSSVSVTPAVVDAVTWTARTATEVNQWYSVTYGNGLFVAVAISGTNRVMTSPDGITWTARAAAAANTWRSVTYGNGLFVAVADSGTNRVMTSPDGITWTPRTAAEASQWRSVTYGNGLFVAVANGGTNRVMTSPDGITWTAGAAAEANTWWSVTYGNGLFVAVAYSGTNRVMTSTDGITWSARAAAEANQWASVTYGNGVFVAVAISGTNRVMTSSDGITWSARAAAEANTWYSVAYGNGVFVAVADSGTNRVMTSPDGVTWSARAAAEANSWYWVTYGNGLFVAVSATGTNRVMTSSLVEPATAPAAPTSLSASAGDGSASISFTPGADGGGAITKYQYRVGSGAWTDAVGTSSPITVTGLTNGIASSVRLRAVNSAGAGAASGPVSVTPRQAGPPVFAATSSGSTGFVVTFDLNPLPGTTVAYQSATAYLRGTNTVAGTCRTYSRQTTCYIGGLSRATNYDLRVTAYLPVAGKTWHIATAEGSIMPVRTNN